ncbi:MAG TPA: ferredoxin [Gammaproteobacteria bacterium]|jgi:ferredoxin|nr:ferredoxin [Gammaproteobacteria bacterium]
MKLVVDFKKCEKAGECYYNHPRLFERSEGGFPILRVRELVDPELLHEAREAVEVCPAIAISVQD